MNVIEKLAILADAAKYDASCASSGAATRDSRGGSGMGSTGGMGICHSYAPDGRCISLLKILLTNFCLFDCRYCINRDSSNVRRARFSVDEVVQLTLDFYRRNLIEGLFLSSGIIQSPDYTMEQLIEVARRLREDEDFRGYIHLKTIPDADSALITRAGRYADRLSINIELPTQASIARLAPQKSFTGIKRSMAKIRLARDENDVARRASRRMRVYRGGPALPASAKRPVSFAPAGQSTQLIVGADDSSDRTVLATAHGLYGAYRMRRVYYSAFSPIPDAAAELPREPAPLLREHRLYQADWLLRFYGFAINEIATNAAGMLNLALDPKEAWAVGHPERFPIDINRAPREELLRVPGLGQRGVAAIMRSRKWAKLRWGDLVAMRVPMRKAGPYVITADRGPTPSAPIGNATAVPVRPRQAALFE